MGRFITTYVLYFATICSLAPPSNALKSTLQDVNLDNPVLNFLSSSVGHDSKHVFCERVRVLGLSRIKMKHYANTFQVIVKPSDTIPERLHGKIQVCFHRNASSGLCDCAKDEWKTIQNGIWSGIMSPFEDKYLDIKFKEGVSGLITVSIEEVFQKWRLFCLGFGFLFLVLAPTVSNWVPFYYSSSMALGILLVILILLFQGMKLLPTGRKSIFYLTLYGTMVGIGSLLVQYLSMFVNSILASFGLSEDMYNPVSIFVLLGIILAGAALGYWIVRKFVLSEDGMVNVGIAQFVKWVMRVIGMVSILQSTLDPILAILSLGACSLVCFLINSKEWRNRKSMGHRHLMKPWVKKPEPSFASPIRMKFLSRPSKTQTERREWGPNPPYAWYDSPSKGSIYPSPNKRAPPLQDYYSTFHKDPHRKRFSKKEWDEFTQESTRQAIAEWASSPEFTDWLVENSDRIQLVPENSSDDTSSSDSSRGTVVESGSGLSLFKWY